MTATHPSPAVPSVAPLRADHQAILSLFKRHGIGVPVKLETLRQELPVDLRGREGLSRRIRELRALGFSIPYKKKAYALTSSEPSGKKSNAAPVRGRDRIAVLLAANGRCQACGRTVDDDGIKLQADHRVPRDWGGTSERSNLWALCHECNIQKRNLYSTFDPEIMRKCMTQPNALMRAGELLKAFDGKPVPRELMSIVTGIDAWERRMRQLRRIGWEYETVYVGGRGKYEYRVTKWAEWPESVSAAIRDEARNRGKKG